MLQDFVDWISHQSTERGLDKIVVSITSVIGVAGATGTLLSSFPLRAAALVFTLLAGLTFSTFLLKDRRLVRRDIGALSGLVQRYCQVIQDDSKVKLEMSDWKQTIVLNQQGDATVTRQIRLTPAGDVLHFLTSNLCYYGDSPLSHRQRRRTRVTAREISADGTKGARFFTTPVWRASAEHQVLVHFRNPIPVGREVWVEVQWTWPLYSADLMEGSIEDFYVTFDHPAETAAQKVIVVKRNKHDRFTASRIGRLDHVDSVPSDKTYEVSFQINRPVLGERYGVRIDKA